MASESSKKHFDSIHDHYAFFQAHSTEADQCAKAIAAHLSGHTQLGPATRLADFGCGDGDFLLSVLNRLGQSVRQNDVHLSLLDLDPTYLEMAEAKARQLGFTKITAAKTLESLATKHDVIISNHVLYYVSDLTACLSSLYSHVAPGGRLLITLADNTNALIESWRLYFSLLGESVPYHLSDAFELQLRHFNLSYTIESISSALTFPDTPYARDSILRFLLGSYFPRVSNIFEYRSHLDRYSDGKTVTMSLKDNLFVIEGPET
jgi:2-polyprenyl-3-methyl-5-hydroxy-6-metoxy-1,4-benzoquinol methylase